MNARIATVQDASEIVRLAALLFESMGLSTAWEPRWREEGERHVRDRLGGDLAVFVVDDPLQAGRLAASAAGIITHRLPTPANPAGLAGYVQWVCTDPQYRGRGHARAVMERLLNWYDERAVGTVELHSTPMAESLYRALGFDDSGARALRRRRS
ncbi:MAG: GNAT family N-acetyltransferase [Acidimicrobiaceae bacterium]|nr:GNAT family N-acetyltransferase [Acidimicrobiaceae bacterium]